MHRKAGYDDGKKIDCSKRHLIVDTLGLVLIVMVTEANVQELDAAQRVLATLFQA